MAKSQIVNALGIDTIKRFLSQGLSAVLQLFQIDANKDGRVSGLEAYLAASQLGNAVIQILPLWPDVKAEKADLTSDELDELVEHVTSLNLMPGASRPEIEEQIDDTMHMVNYNRNFILRTKKRFAKTDGE